jgi:hypothetical protein
MDSRLRLITQDSDDAIQFIEKKNVRRAAGELNHNPPENISNAERESNYPVQRIFGNGDEMRAAEFGTQRLAERIEWKRLFLEFFSASMGEIESRTRGIDADKEKLAPQAEIDRKRNRPELIDLAKVPPAQYLLKLFNNTLQDCLIHPRKNPQSWI